MTRIPLDTHLTTLIPFVRTLMKPATTPLASSQSFMVRETHHRVECDREPEVRISDPATVVKDGVGSR